MGMMSSVEEALKGGASGHGGGTSGWRETKKSNHSNSYVGF